MGVAQAKPACKHTIATRKCYQYNTILTCRSENDYKLSGVHTPNNVREFKQIHGNQYKLIHLRLEAKMAASVRERILRAMFVNSKRFATVVQTSSEVTRCVRINSHGKYPANSTIWTV